VEATIVSASGSVSPDPWAISPADSDDHAQPDVAELANGDLAFVWRALPSDGGQSFILGAVFSSLGTAKTTVFPVSGAGEWSRSVPRIAALANGFFVAWNSVMQDGDSSGVYGRQFDAGGTAAAPEFILNSEVAGSQIFAATESLSNGDFLVTWYSNHGGAADVFLRRISLK
jgi:hypothetical protein